MSGRSHPGLRHELVRGPLAELDGGAALAAISSAPRRRRRDPLPRRCISTVSSVSSTTCSTTSTGRRWRTRSRCACRSSTTTSSSSARRSRRGYKVRRLDTKHVLKHAVRGLIPDRDHRQAQGRLLQRRGRRLVPRSDPRRDQRLPARPDRATRRCSTATAVERLVTRHADGTDTRHARRCCFVLMLEVWLVDVPAARDRGIELRRARR